MLRMGVPAAGVKVKMAAEGADPDMLDQVSYAICLRTRYKKAITDGAYGATRILKARPRPALLLLLRPRTARRLRARTSFPTSGVT
eukprot:2687535-Rhodomonas_salina.2